MTKPQPPSYEFGRFRLDIAERWLLRDGKPVPLTPKVFDTLLALIENAGRLVAKAELLARLWPDTFVEEATLARNVSDLRKALGESPDGEKYIETVPKAGYRFSAPVREIEPDNTGLTIQRRTRARVVVEEELEDDARSIAVLPFKLFGSGAADEHLGLGLADALITRLSNIRRIEVRPTSSVLKYAGSADDPIEAGRELGVEAVLDGGIQHSGDRIRVTVQLVSVSTKAALWAGTFDEKFTDLFSVEDSISQRVADALTLKLTGEERKLLAKRYTENTDAYQLYLKGRYYWNKRTTESMKKGIECFEQAIRIDPQYALAYGGLADCYTKLGDVGITAVPPKEAFSKAKAAAVSALAIDNSLAEAHASLAHLHMHHYEWRAAEQEFIRAIELNPGYPSAHHWFAYYLSFTGHPDESLAEISFAANLDPLSLIIATDVGEILYFARRYDEAIDEIQAALEMDPHYFAALNSLARVYEQQQMYEQAIAAFQRASVISESNPDTLASLAHAYAVSGQSGEASKLLEQLLAGDRYVSQYHIAIIYLGLGDEGKALDWLTKAYEERAEWIIYLTVDPRLDRLREKPRFRDLLKRVGLE